MTIEKYVRLKDVMLDDIDQNIETIEFGTANWKLIEDGENHAWACEHCGHVGGHGWDEPKYKYCGGCGFRMEKRS